MGLLLTSCGVITHRRTQKFLNAKKKVKPSTKVWLEVIGSRLSIYDSEDKVQELARLQLSDIEVERVDEEARLAGAFSSRFFNPSSRWFPHGLDPPRSYRQRVGRTIKWTTALAKAKAWVGI